MAFPDESLDLRFDVYLGDDDGWVDLSGRLLGDVRVKRGAGDGASGASAGSATLTLDDDDGALTPLYALSPYYPHVVRGAPARLAVRRGRDAFGRTVSSGWGSADSGQAWTVSGGSASDFAVSGGAATHSHTSTNATKRSQLDLTLADVEQISDISVPVAITGAAAVAGHLARVQGTDFYWFRLEFNAGGSTTTLKISRQLSTGSTDIAELIDVPGLTYTAGQPIRLRSLAYGPFLAVKAWGPGGPEPRDWMLTVTDDAITSPGQVGLRTWLVAGNSNALPLAISMSSYSAQVGRLVGEIASYRSGTKPRTDGTLVTTTTVQVAGALRRLGQGSPPAYSALRWYIASPEHSGLIDYWPLEDGHDASSAASAVAGGAPLRAGGAVAFASISPEADAEFVVGTQPLPDLSGGGTLAGPARQTGTSSPVQWTVQWAGEHGNAGSSAAYTPFRWTTSDGAVWEIGLTGSPDNNTVLRRNSSVIVEDGTAFLSLFEWRVTAIQSGGNILVQLIVNGSTQGDVTPGGAGPWTATVAGTLGRVRHVAVNPGMQVTSPEVHAVGHIQVWDTIGAPQIIGQFTTDSYGGTVGNAWWSHKGEAAPTRMARVAAQAQMPVIAVPADAEAPTRVGNQRPGDGLSLLRETAEADLGLLVEARDTLALLYHPRATLYNRPVRLVVDMATYRTAQGTSGQVLAPVYDDQGLRNDVTVARVGGSSARAVDEESVASAGRHDHEVELTLAADGALADVAGWLEHLGTADETRHPSLPVDLAANPGLIDEWLCVDIGSRVQRINVPAPHTGTIDQLVDGYSEVLGPRRWTVAANCSPARPWDVAEADGDARAPADGSTLAADLDAGAMTLSLASTAANGVWTTDAADYPMDVRVGGVNGSGGERITLSGLTGGSSPQTATIGARGVNGITRAWPAGTSVDVWDSAIAPL